MTILSMDSWQSWSQIRNFISVFKAPLKLVKIIYPCLRCTWTAVLYTILNLWTSTWSTSTRWILFSGVIATRELLQATIMTGLEPVRCGSTSKGSQIYFLSPSLKKLASVSLVTHWRSEYCILHKARESCLRKTQTFATGCNTLMCLNTKKHLLCCKLTARILKGTRRDRWSRWSWLARLSWY